MAATAVIRREHGRQEELGEFDRRFEDLSVVRPGLLEGSDFTAHRRESPAGNAGEFRLIVPPDRAGDGAAGGGTGGLNG